MSALAAEPNIPPWWSVVLPGEIHGSVASVDKGKF
jgi:hypothetical protein